MTRWIAVWPWMAALLTCLAIVPLSVTPASLAPLALAYQHLCERYSVLGMVPHRTSLPLVLIMLLGLIAFANGTRVATRMLIGTYRFNQRLQKQALPLPPRLMRLARTLDLDGRLTVLEQPHAAAFCYGFRRPAVAVTAGLLAGLDDEEMLAVLAHEREHLRQRDPLRYLAVRSVAAAAFMVPLAPVLRERIEMRIELRADRAALAVAPRGALAGALLTVMTGPRLETAGVAGLSATEARIASLAGHHVLPPVPRGAVVMNLGLLSGIGLAAVDVATAAELVRAVCDLCPTL